MQLLGRRHGREGRKAGEKNSSGRDGRPSCRREKKGPVRNGKKRISGYKMLPLLYLRPINKVKHKNHSKLKILLSYVPLVP